MRNFSSMIEDVRSQTGEVMAATDRLRAANRALTGSTGETPTVLASAKGERQETAAEPPLMEALNFALERLNAATADLRNEIAHIEGVSETRRDVAEKGYAEAVSAKTAFVR